MKPIRLALGVKLAKVTEARYNNYYYFYYHLLHYTRLDLFCQLQTKTRYSSRHFLFTPSLFVPSKPLIMIYKPDELERKLNIYIQSRCGGGNNNNNYNNAGFSEIWMRDDLLG